MVAEVGLGVSNCWRFEQCVDRLLDATGWNANYMDILSDDADLARSNARDYSRNLLRTDCGIETDENDAITKCRLRIRGRRSLRYACCCQDAQQQRDASR